MMMQSKIVAGDYAGCGIHYNKGYFGTASSFEVVSKQDMFGKPIGVSIKKSNITSIEVGGSENDFRAGQAIVGAALLGPVGLLAGGNNKRFSVVINWKDGKRSLCDLNKNDYNELQKIMF